MPHCVMEYTNNIEGFPDLSHFFDQLHKTLVKTREFRLQDIKSRAIGYDQFFMGDGNRDNAYITLTLSIMSGRSESFKKTLSENLLSLMQSYFDCVNVKGQFSLTVRFTDIEKDSYSRTIVESNV